MISSDKPREVSRRRLLHQIACATGAAVALVASMENAQAGKMPQSAVGYQPTPQGDHKCGNCRLFQPPDACQSVAGTVSANGWCRIWVKK